MKKRPSVTIGIPVHNEEKSIRNTLSGILKQNKKNFLLENILIIADGCTDKTVEIISEFSSNHSKIKLICDGKRMGKAMRLNEIYKINKSDYLITLDADIKFGNEFVLEKLIEPLSDPEVFVVAGNPRPLPARNLIEKLVVTKDSWWYEVRKKFNKGSNIYNSSGICFAFRKEFTDKFRFLGKVINDQEVIFLQTMQINKKFVFVKEAIVNIREVSKLKELFVRAGRFEYYDDLSGYNFGTNIEKYYKVPYLLIFKSISKLFFKEPFNVIMSLFLAFLLKFTSFAESRRKYLSFGLWKISKSTKELN